MRHITRVELCVKFRNLRPVKLLSSMRLVRQWLFVVLLQCMVIPVWSQQVIPSKGKEFWLGFMRNWGLLSTSGSLDVFISSDQATTGTISIPASGLQWPFTVVPGVTTTVNIPMSAALHSASEVVENKGVLVLAQDTVSVFAINYEQNTADGTVVYPIESLGTDHRIMSYTGINTGPNAGGEFLIVATKDGTEVEIITTGPTLLGNAAGVPWTVALDSGQTYQVRAQNPSVDLTGSRVRSTAASGTCRPFAVFSGAACSEVPMGCWACDHLFEQQLPVNTWGTSYYAAPFATTTSHGYRVLALENGTEVSINGAAPVVLNAGQWLDNMSATTATCIQADKPISAAQFMGGFMCSGAGDPSMLQLSSEEQVMDRITFSTIVSSIITQHYVNVVISTADIGTLILDGTAIAGSAFIAFPQCPNKVYAQLPLTPGSHTLECPNGFSAYVYGTGQEESYAYSVGSFTPVPPPPIHETVCGTDSDGTVTLTPPYAIQDPFWYRVDTPEDTLFVGNTFVLQPTTSAVYVVEGFELVSQCPVEFLFSVELEMPPELNVTAAEPAVCALTPVQLSVEVDPPGDYVITWSPPALFSDPQSSSPTVVPTADTWYVVEVSTLSGCAISRDSVLVTASVGELLDLTAFPADTTICRGQEVQLGITTRGSLVFDTFDGGTWGPGWSQVQGANVNADCGSVSGEALQFNGGIVRQATTVDLDMAQGGVVRFSLIIGTGLAPCENADPGDDVVLEISTDGGATWAVLATYPEWAYPTFTSVEEVIPAAGSSTNTRFRWRQLGTWMVGEDNWAIDNVSIARNGVTPGLVTWSPEDGLNDPESPSPIAQPLSTTTYTATVLDGSGLCSHTASVDIVVVEPFSISVSPDTLLCSAIGLPIQVLFDIPDATVAWEPPASVNDPGSSSPTVEAEGSQVFIVNVVDPDGCAVVDSVVVTVAFDDLPPPMHTLFCAGGSVVLDPGQPDAQHLWSNGATTSFLVVDTSGTFSVQLIHPLGCEAEWHAEVQVVEPPQVDLGPDVAFCSGESIELSTGPQFQVEWSTGSNEEGLLIASSGEYWVQVTGPEGCTARDTIQVLVYPLPALDLSDTTACDGVPLQLSTGLVDLMHEWTNGATDQTVTLDSSVDSIGVTVTDTNGCSTTAEISISWLTFPIVDLGTDTVLCQGEVLTLDPGSPAETFLWSTGSTAPTIQVSEGGLYWVVAANGPCATSDSLGIALMVPPISLLPETVSFCPDDPPFQIELVASTSSLVHVWTTPSGVSPHTGNTLVVREPGIYSVTISDPWGCRTTDATLVITTCPGTLFVPNAFTPDGNGFNDVFRPVGTHIQDLELLVFNRWGELIFQGFGGNAAWDGTYKGEICPDGVYPWRILYSVGDEGLTERKQAFGHVTLLR